MARKTISKENADIQALRFLDYYEINEDKEDKDKSEGYQVIKRTLSRMFAQGRVSIKEGEDIKLIQHLKNGEELEYNEVTGAAKMEMDKYDGEYQKQYALVGALTRKGFDVISKLKSKDLSDAEALATLFLLV